jgi:hypothetical protein
LKMDEDGIVLHMTPLLPMMVEAPSNEPALAATLYPLLNEPVL